MDKGSDNFIASQTQERFNKSLFNEQCEYHMSEDEFKIKDGFQYSLAVFMKFFETMPSDTVAKRLDFVKTLCLMRQELSYPLIPRYVVMVYADGIILVYDLYDYLDRYKLIDQDNLRNPAKIMDSNFYDRPSDQFNVDYDDLTRVLVYFRTLTTCLNTDSRLICFDGEEIVEYGIYKSFVIGKYINWDDGEKVFYYDRDILKQTTVKHVPLSGDRLYDRSERKYDVSADAPVVILPNSAMLNKDKVLSSPLTIYAYLKDRVYKQDDYCKWASSIIYNHLNGIPSVYLVSGPSGCGKTFLWESVREVYDKVAIIDASSITQSGFKGMNINQVMSAIEDEDGIVVFDEFDKLCRSIFESHGTNISLSVQSNFLKILDEGIVAHCSDGSDSGMKMRSTKKMTFILCGSFNEKAEEIAEKAKSSNFGFGRRQEDIVKTYEKDITMNDVIEYGMIKELASRIIGMTCVKPLSLQDYVNFIRSNGKVIKQVEDAYGYKITVSEEVCRDIAKEAFECGLGLRNVLNRLRQKIDMGIFDQWERLEQTGEMVL